MSGSQMLIGLTIILASCSGQTSSTENTSEVESIEWNMIDRPSRAHLRGLDVGTDGSIWSSGTQGTVLRSLDSGRTWTSWNIPNAENLDFRDIEAFDANHACVLSSGNGVAAYFTEDGGKSWNLSYKNEDTLKFFDGMDFLDGLGYAFGDPIEGKLQLLKSLDSGKHWVEVPELNLPSTIPGEAGYAASGTGIVLKNEGLFIATGGGENSRLLSKTAESEWQARVTPIKSGPGFGMFSMVALDDGTFVVVGGDYVDSTNSSSSASYSSNGIDWEVPTVPPNGYRSCITYDSINHHLVTCGRTGSDFSRDNGKTWTQLSPIGFYACITVGDQLIGVGRNGKMGLFDLNRLTVKFENN